MGKRNISTFLNYLRRIIGLVSSSKSPIPLPIVFIIFFYGLLVLHPIVFHPTHIPMLADYQETDLLSTHLPISKQINYAISTFHQIPLWNIFQFSGQPLVADPLSGYWYLPNWLTFLFPFPITFNILIFLHLVWSGIGMYIFLTKKRLMNIPALFGALCWMGTPKIIGYLAGGQISTIFAFAWLPWLFIVCEDFINLTNKKTLIHTAAIISTIILVDIRWGFFCTIFVSLYIVWNISSLKKSNFINISRFFVALAFFVFLMTAILTLPMYEFMSLSRRAGLTLQDLNFLSIDPKSLIAIFAPQIGINYEQIIYLGIFPLVLAVFGINKKNLFWLFSIIFSIFYGLGGHTFFYPVLIKIIPFLSWLRVPSRSWFFLIFSVSVLAGYGLQRIMGKQFEPGVKKMVNLVSVSISFFAIFLSIGLFFVIGNIPPGMLIMSIFLPISFLGISIVITKEIPNNLSSGFIIVILVADILVVNNTILSSYSIPQSSQIVQWVENQPGLFRTFSPSYSLPMPNYLQQANGVNPMHLDSYANFVKQASNYSTGKYSVSLPDIYIDKNTPKEIVESAKYPDTELLGKLNVKFIASSFKLHSENLSIMFEANGQYLYENLSFKERSWYDGGTTQITKWSPNEIVLTSKGESGTIFLSEIQYPGWKAWVDGIPTQITVAEKILRSVNIGEGKHNIVFKFIPTSFVIGFIISIITWCTAFISELLSILNQKSNEHSIKK
ncbi:MAG: YfhO family protein [Anaerolineaceae bacterium]